MNKKEQIVTNDKLSVPYSIVDAKVCEAIASLDAEAWSNNPREYVEANKVTYFILINSWLLQFDDIFGSSAYRLRHMTLLEMQGRGLFAVVSDYKEVSERFLRGTINYSSTMIGVNPNEDSYFVYTIATELTNLNRPEDILQICRYPKRFSPIGADRALLNAVEKFNQVNARCKILNRSNPIHWLEERVSEKLHSMLCYFEDYFLVDDDITFSSGSSADCGKILANKLIELSYYEDNLGSPLYPLPVTNTRKYFNAKTYSVRPIAVPKSLEEWRIIAPENVVAGYHMQRVRRAMKASMRATGWIDRFDPDDQESNRGLAKLGSIDSSYATSDLSSASDSIARAFAYRVLPDAIVSEVDKWLPAWLMLNGSYRRCQMYATSGNPSTFNVEGCIFLAICAVADDMYEFWTGDKPNPSYVFGDDIIIDTRVQETAHDLLQMLGFKVNTLKSYGVGTTFRESCGVEYFDGYPVSTKYFPRTQWDWRRPQLVYESAVDLQHRLYAYPKTSMWLQDAIRHIFGCETASVPGTTCSDPWGSAPVRGSSIGQYRLARVPRNTRIELKNGQEVYTHKGKEITPSTSIVVQKRPVPIMVQPTLAQLREVHCGFDTTFNQPPVANEDVRRQAVEMYRYAEFLKYGPKYASPEDKALGISMRSVSGADYFNPTYGPIKGIVTR